MNILITGVTETHTNHPQRASSTKFVSIPELMASAFGRMGHHVDHRAVTSGEDLTRYDKVFVYLYPLDHNALMFALMIGLSKRSYHHGKVRLHPSRCVSIHGLHRYFHGATPRPWACQ